MKLMKMFQIEKDYQIHKKRLFSIKSTDAKRKVSTCAFNNLDKINNYKSKRSCSTFFNQYQKDNDIMKINKHLHKALTKVYDRDAGKNIIKQLVDHSNTIKQRVSTQNSARSLASSRLKQQNQKITKKINMASSCYKKFRNNKYKKIIVTQFSHRQQIIKILQDQLGSKPQVIFPLTTKKAKQSTRSLHKSFGKRNKQHE